MKVHDYKKKVENFDHLTDNKSVEAVEEMVKYIPINFIIFLKNSFGEMLLLVPLFMVLISKAVYLMME